MTFDTIPIKDTLVVLIKIVCFYTTSYKLVKYDIRNIKLYIIGILLLFINTLIVEIDHNYFYLFVNIVVIILDSFLLLRALNVIKKSSQKMIFLLLFVVFSLLIIIIKTSVFYWVIAACNMVFITPLIEEFIYREVALMKFEKNKILSALIVSFIFSVLHLTYLDYGKFILVFILSIVCCFFWYRYRLLAAFFVHSIYNLIVFLMFIE